MEGEERKGKEMRGKKRGEEGRGREGRGGEEKRGEGRGWEESKGNFTELHLLTGALRKHQETRKSLRTNSPEFARTIYPRRD